MPLPEDEAAVEAIAELEKRRTERDLPGWFDKTIKPWFAGMFETVWSGFTDFFPETLRRIWNGIVGVYSPMEKTLWTGMLLSFKDRGWLDKEAYDQLLQLRNAPHPIDWYLFVNVMTHFHTTYLDTVFYNTSSEMRHNLASIHSPEIPDPGTLAAASFIAPEKTAIAREAMKKAGFADEYIDLIFLSRYRIYDEGMVRDLFLRGVLTTDQMFMRMRELGYTDTRIKEIAQSWEIIPGPMDLFHLVAKEAFEPSMIEKMGLDDEFPAAQIDWLKKQGISEDWARKYWYAHWDQPSIGQGFEMLHRGVIGRDELDMLFRTVEIPPFWRDKLTKIAFMPLTRVDSRRMHDLGVLTDDELIKVYMDQGYDETNARRMADFTIRYNREKDRDLTKGEILTGYKEKLISKDETYEFLKEMEYDFREADYLITKVDYDQAKKIRDMQVKQIGERFKNNLVEEFDTRAQLNALDLAGNYVDVLVEEWRIDKMEALKIPSKTDMDKFLRAKIIDETRYNEEMKRLGYSVEYTNWYLQLAKKK
ncbi:hypothetical protein ES703_44131 [subsurface metagenome]